MRFSRSDRSDHFVGLGVPEPRRILNVGQKHRHCSGRPLDHTQITAIQPRGSCASDHIRQLAGTSYGRTSPGMSICGSEVASCVLCELQAGGQTELGVDVGEVGVHGVW